MADLSVRNEGSIHLLRPLTDAGREWIKDHIPEDAPRFGNAVAVQHCYIIDVCKGAQKDGLTIEDDQ